MIINSNYDSLAEYKAEKSYDNKVYLKPNNFYTNFKYGECMVTFKYLIENDGFVNELDLKGVVYK